jgi:hypothetical protein
MATNFPTSLDDLTNPTSTDGLDNPSHSSQHANANDAIEALQAKVGVNGSAVTTSLDYLVTRADARGSSGLASGSYYCAKANTNLLSSLNMTLNTVHYTPFLVERTQSFDRIACRTETITGSLTIRLGIYNNSNKQPSTVLLDAGTVVGNVSTTVYSITINQTLDAGWYWLAGVVQAVTTGNAAVTTIGNISSFDQGLLTATFNGFNPTWSQASVTGAFATATSLSGNSTNRMLVALRAA